MDAVHAATQDCFGAIQQIRRTDPNLLPQPEVLQRRMRTFVDRMQSSLRDAGLNHADVEDITYAVCALADEVALNSGEPLASGWMGNLLQFHYFRENTAGDGFFNRLEAIRKDPRRKDVLRVYALCLWFGFQGRYRVRGGGLRLELPHHDDRSDGDQGRDGGNDGKEDRDPRKEKGHRPQAREQDDEEDDSEDHRRPPETGLTSAISSERPEVLEARARRRATKRRRARASAPAAT